ncbi:sensor histidine kinase [Paenibacillus rhizoplanae]
MIEEDRYQDELEMRYYINIAYEKSLTLRRLIDELFEYTRINNGMPLELSELDIAGLIRQLEEEFVPITENAGMEIRLNMQEGEFKIQADGGLLVRAYENIIANAIQYGKAGRYIDIDIAKDGDVLVVRIQNYGDPIPERDLPFIFLTAFTGWSAPGRSRPGAQVSDWPSQKKHYRCTRREYHCTQ